MNTADLLLNIQIAALDEDGNQEIYDVTEFYRMRYTETRIMLLDFKRSASQVFEESFISISDKGLLLGVRDKNVEYMMNEKAGVLAFVQEGDLWSYSPDDGKFSRIFSFRKETDGDFRDSRYQHNIKIIRVEDNGDCGLCSLWIYEQRRSGRILWCLCIFITAMIRMW